MQKQTTATSGVEAQNNVTFAPSPLGKATPILKKLTKRFLSESHTGKTSHDGKTQCPAPGLFAATAEQRAERLFQSVAVSSHDTDTCVVCRRTASESAAKDDATHLEADEVLAMSEMSFARKVRSGSINASGVLARFIQDQESEFAHYKAAYVELADAYKLMQPEDGRKRQVLADHLQEVISTLEAKADRIDALKRCI